MNASYSSEASSSCESSPLSVASTSSGNGLCGVPALRQRREMEVIEVAGDDDWFPPPPKVRNCSRCPEDLANVCRHAIPRQDNPSSSVIIFTFVRNSSTTSATVNHLLPLI